MRGSRAAERGQILQEEQQDNQGSIKLLFSTLLCLHNRRSIQQKNFQASLSHWEGKISYPFFGSLQTPLFCKQAGDLCGSMLLLSVVKRKKRAEASPAC